MSQSPVRRVLQRFPGCLALIFGAALALATPSMTENAVANGDTRTIHLFYIHTQESIDATYLVNGRYDRNVLQQLNWFLRDWRRDEPTEMDPRLFDVVWEAYRDAGAADERITVMSAYRSPETNAMLRSRSHAVARFSQHMLGKAMDTSMPGMPMSRVREVGMRMQRGGVGYYPTAGTPFVHLDVGNVRAWPRMSYEQLVRLFPDGKTVHLPSNGQPLARYDEAKAEIEARNNGAIVTAPRPAAGNFFAWLFGGGGEDEAEEVQAPPPVKKRWADIAPRMSRAQRQAALERDEEEGSASPPPTKARVVLAKAEADLPRGETVMQAPREVIREAPPAVEEKSGLDQQREPEQEKIALVKAPRPPERPTSIDQPVALEKPTPREKPAAIDKPEPLDAEPSDVRLVATLDPEAETKPPRSRVVEAPQEDAAHVEAPQPPRRPRDLYALAPSSAPLPPSRPSSLIAPVDAPATSSAAALPPPPPARPKHLGAVAPTGPAASALAKAIEPTGSIEPNEDGEGRLTIDKDGALAFAPPRGVAKTRSQASTTRNTTTKPQGKAALVPARLDRSNFGAMTNDKPTSHATESSVLGASIGNVRSTARGSESGVLAKPSVAASHGFRDNVSAPDVDGFVSAPKR